MIVVYTDEHVMSFTPGDCIECGKELQPVEYINVQELKSIVTAAVSEALENIRKRTGPFDNDHP